MSEKDAVAVTPELLPEVKLPKAFNTWEEMIGKFKHSIKTVKIQTLQTFYDLGGQVELIKRKSPYGGKGVADLAKDLGDNTSESKLYDAATVYLFLDRERLSVYKEKGYSPYVVTELARVKDVKLLPALEAKIDAHEIIQKEIKDEVRKVNSTLNEKAPTKKKEKVDHQTATSRLVKSFAGAVGTMCDKAGKKLLETEEMMEAFESLDDNGDDNGPRTKTLEVVGESFTKLNSLHGRLCRAIYTVGHVMQVDEAELAPFKPAAKPPKKK